MNDLNQIEKAHNELVARKAKSGSDILKSLTPEKCDLLHAILGMTTELGEIADTIKKHVIYEQDLDIENLIEEDGDECFYQQLLRQTAKITREVSLLKNMAKLDRRYVGGFSNGEAAIRRDKQDEERNE